VIRRKIGAAKAALLLLTGPSLMCFAQTGGSPSAGKKGVAGSPKAEGMAARVQPTIRVVHRPVRRAWRMNRHRERYGNQYLDAQSIGQKGLNRCVALFRREMLAQYENNNEPH
jgi:hypothetical protein